MTGNGGENSTVLSSLTAVPFLMAVNDKWILRLGLAAVRRMTAWLEVSSFHIGMKGGFSPLFIWISYSQKKVIS